MNLVIRVYMRAGTFKVNYPECIIVHPTTPLFKMADDIPRNIVSWRVNYGSLIRVVTYHCSKPRITYAGMICCLCSEVQFNTKTIDCFIVAVTLKTDPGKMKCWNNISSFFRIVGPACCVVSGLREHVFGHTKTTLRMRFSYWLVKSLSLVTGVSAVMVGYGDFREINKSSTYLWWIACTTSLLIRNTWSFLMTIPQNSDCTYVWVP